MDNSTLSPKQQNQQSQSQFTFSKPQQNESGNEDFFSDILSNHSNSNHKEQIENEKAKTPQNNNDAFDMYSQSQTHPTATPTLALSFFCFVLCVLFP